jgi:hypothetical protein
VLLIGPHDSCVQELTAGTLRGHYKIVRRLGQGGMGVGMRWMRRNARAFCTATSSDVVLITDLTGKQPH